jgi:hypothetical protein
MLGQKKKRNGAPNQACSLASAKRHHRTESGPRSLCGASVRSRYLLFKSRNGFNWRFREKQIPDSTPAQIHSLPASGRGHGWRCLLFRCPSYAGPVPTAFLKSTLAVFHLPAITHRKDESVNINRRQQGSRRRRSGFRDHSIAAFEVRESASADFVGARDESESIKSMGANSRAIAPLQPEVGARSDAHFLNYTSSCM